MLVDQNSKVINTIMIETNILAEIAKKEDCVEFFDLILKYYNVAIPVVSFSEFNLGNTNEKEDRFSFALQGFVLPSVSYELLKNANHLLNNYVNFYHAKCTPVQKKEARNKHRNDVQIFLEAKSNNIALITNDKIFDRFNNVFYSQHTIVNGKKPFGDPFFRLPVFNFKQLERSFYENVNYEPISKDKPSNKAMGIKQNDQEVIVEIDWDASKDLRTQGFVNVATDRDLWNYLKNMVLNLDNNYAVARYAGGIFVKKVNVKRIPR